MWNQVNWHFKEGKDHQPISLKRTCFLKALRSTSLFGMGGPGGSVVKHPPANAGGSGSIPGWERSPRERNPLRYSRLEHSVDGEPGRLQSRGLQRVRHGEHTHTHTHRLKFPMGSGLPSCWETRSQTHQASFLSQFFEFTKYNYFELFLEVYFHESSLFFKISTVYRVSWNFK